MSENVEEIISPSGKYKAVIIEKPNFCTIDIYVLSEDFEPENDFSYGEYWSRKNTSPILIEKGFYAIKFAIDELRNLMYEPDSPLSIEWVKDFSFCQEARFIDPNDVEVFSVWIDNNEKKSDKIEAKTIIDFMGLCIVEEGGCEGEWQMGKLIAMVILHVGVHMVRLKKQLWAFRREINN